MPNHVTTIIKADGAVLDYLRGVCVHQENWNSDNLVASLTDVDFNQVIPQPSNINIGSENYKNIPAGKVSWYDWNSENWGTKWNAYEVSRPVWNEVRFQTAWAHPFKVIKALSLKFPVDTIWVDYADEDTGYNLGRYKIVGGEIWEGLDFEEGSDEACEFACQICYGRSYEEMKEEWDDDR